MFLKNFIKFSQNWRNFNQKFRKKVNEILGIHGMKSTFYFLESLNLDISLSKTKVKKIFLIPYSTLDKFSNDTSLNSLRWIYRSAKIDWTKKPIWVYSSSPPQEGSEQINPYVYHGISVVIIFSAVIVLNHPRAAKAWPWPARHGHIR